MPVNTLFFHELGHIVVYVFPVTTVLLVLLTVPSKRGSRFGIKSLNERQLLYLAIFGFLVSMLMDADHLVDYLFCGNFLSGLGGFFSGACFGSSHRVIVPLHAWELALVGAVVLLWAYRSGKWARWRYYLFFGVIGMILHLTYDTLYYGFNPTSYFLIWRFVNAFSDRLFVH